MNKTLSYEEKDFRTETFDVQFNTQLLSIHYVPGEVWRYIDD